ncbi:hypothetical protein BGZ99_003460 [Dissophora globulifera]|uniref:Uncharacterized protein n=1 Tax=Dissophora globulifera TaxID=979702 RepID=A0A9P6RPB0_9FUNG|nr:hypothetical protein BGZ99_003460 [Dissophora globulifera]
MLPASKLTDKGKSRRRESSEKSKSAKNHNFTPAQESFYAKTLSNPELWKRLDGKGDKNTQNEFKIDILGNISHQFNLAFSTEEQSLNLTALQMKNKLRTMQAKWKEANMLLKSTGNVNFSSSTLEDRVKKVCHYYYVLYPVWHTSWAMNPKEPLQLTSNLSRVVSDLDDESTDDSDGDDTNGDQRGTTRARQDSIPTNDQQLPTISTATSVASSMPTATLTAASTGEKMKMMKNDLYTAVMKDLVDAQVKGFDLKRRKLVLEEANQSAQQRIMALQERKLELDVQAQEEQSQLDSYERETKMKKLKLERMRVDIEIRHAEDRYRD